MATPASASMPAPVPEKLAGWTLQRLPAPEDHVGKLFAGRYMILRKIGSGGMSTIFEARDATLGVPVVVKIMRADLPSDPVDRFRREALVLASLAHEHIGRIIDRQDPDDGPRFLVADYIDGTDLARLRRRGPAPAPVVLQIGLQVSAALAYAHAEGVIHRDIKPSNVMLVRHPGGDVFAKVIDFGIAKLSRDSDLADAAPPGARRETRNIVPGTVPYWGGLEGPARDVYALALMLAELLTGEDPDPAVDLTRPGIPAGLAKVLYAALHAEVTSMDALHAALRETDVQTPGEAEAERRRYVAQVFPVAPAEQTAATADTPRFAGRYIVCGELGEGGMGRVQIAFDMVSRRHVALKTIHPRCAGMKNLEHRFRREAWALAAIGHPGAPTMYDSSLESGPFFTMEIVEGLTLSAVLREGRLDPHRALCVAIDLARILHAAHEVGVIHRDVKPDNIVIEQGDRVRLLDFGACLLMPRFHQRHLLFPATPPEQRFATGDLEAVGTPGYTAPEILELRGGAGPRSDVYSVCVVLYEMLTGRRYESPSAGKAQPIERGEFPTALGSIANLLRRGAAREPSERPWSMADLLRSLEIVRAGYLGTRRRQQLVAVAVLAVMSTVAIVGMALRLTAIPEEVAPTTAPLPPDLNVAAPLIESPPPPADHPDDATARPDLDPPRKPDPPAEHPATPQASSLPPATKTPTMLTEARVQERLATRHDKLARCGAPMLVLNLSIVGRYPELTSANGMSRGDPLHTCVRDAIGGLTFPPQREPQKFTMTLNLDPSTG